jgi:hypothetical protein
MAEPNEGPLTDLFQDLILVRLSQSNRHGCRLLYRTVGITGVEGIGGGLEDKSRCHGRGEMTGPCVVSKSIEELVEGKVEDGMGFRGSGSSVFGCCSVAQQRGT